MIHPAKTRFSPFRCCAYSYYSSDKNWDGKYRRIRVQVRNPDLVVRTREGYIASPPTRGNGDGAAQAMAFALSSSLHYGGIGVSARMNEAANPRELRVVVNTGDLRWVGEGSATEQQVATVSVVSANVAKDGKVLNYKVETRHARAAAEATKNNEAEFVVPMKVEPRAALVRVVVRDQGSGHIGSYDVPLK